MRTLWVSCVTVVAALTISSAAFAEDCPGNKDALGVSRTLMIDTTQGPAFGFEHYKYYDFLKPKEVVLTFDDGPLPSHTVTVLKALRHHCTKATFFPVGKLAIGYPEVLREVAADGHTIANHTWWHKNLSSKKHNFDYAKDEIEKGASAVKAALGKAGAPFFRYPYLKDTPESLKYLGSRNFAIFSTDIDSFDFKRGDPKKVVKRVMGLLKKKGKGIILFHDANPYTARAMPDVLDALKKDGYKVVHLVPKAPAETLANYDEEVVKLMNRGRPNMGLRPITSVISTVPDESSKAPPPVAEVQTEEQNDVQAVGSISPPSLQNETEQK